jgi:hypothetical protein
MRMNCQLPPSGRQMSAIISMPTSPARTVEEVRGIAAVIAQAIIVLIGPIP